MCVIKEHDGGGGVLSLKKERVRGEKKKRKTLNFQGFLQITINN